VKNEPSRPDPRRRRPLSRPLRALGLLCVVIAGCKGTAKDPDFERWKNEQDKRARDEAPVWKTIDHPAGQIYGSVARGKHTFKTKGTGRPNRDEKVDAHLVRVGLVGSAGVMIDFMASSDDMTFGTFSQSLDVFAFANWVVRPTSRFRFQSRPGFYWLNSEQGAEIRGDINGWTVGFRFDGEAEYDLVKARRFHLSLFGSGRIGGGGGFYTAIDAPKGRGVSWGYGWEAGLRAQVNRFYGSLSWMERVTTLEPHTPGSAEYGFQGASLTLGIRW
jgi:hypothetical protein